MHVPHGSVRNAIAVVELGNARYGQSNFVPAASSALQNASRPFTSKPM